jgi:hypothetical protein
MGPMTLAVHRLAPIAVFVLAGAACRSPPPPRAPECPSGRWCGTLDQAEALGQTREHVLTCPMYVTWGDGGAAAPGADLPPAAEGKLDLEATRARRLTGAADSCCYAWLTHCPEGKPLPSGSNAPGKRGGDR